MPTPFQDSSEFVVQGRLIIDPARAPELGWLRVSAGRIAEVSLGELPRSLAPPAVGGRDRLVSPAFTDAHIHLPQIDSVGCDGMELLDWLAQVIFPAEQWWGRGKALVDAGTAVRRMLIFGLCLDERHSDRLCVNVDLDAQQVVNPATSAAARLARFQFQIAGLDNP